MSMNLVRDAVGVLKDLETSRTQSDVLSGITLFTKSFGFEHVSILKKPMLADDHVPEVLLTAAPSEFIADFGARGYAKYNPLWNQAEKTAAPFTALEARHRRLSEQEVEVLEHIHRKLDLSDGYIIPVRDDAHGAGAVMFGGHRPKQDPVTHSVLNMLGHCMFGQVHDIMAAFAGEMEQPTLAKSIAPNSKTEATHPLTARERECLQWVARGKTDFEIGIILGISARTARFHIENSKRKLGVASRVQAVTEAMRLGGIAA